MSPSPDRERFAGRVVLVTGATHGIGRAVAERLAAQDASVVGASIDGPGGARTAPSASGAGVFHTRVDVRDEAAVVDLFQWVEANYPPLGALVNCAGVGVFKPLAETSLAEWNDVMAVNAAGVFLCTREAVRRMARAGGGRVVNFGSVADHVPLPGNAAYGASKAAVRLMTQVVNEEYKHQGVRATLLSLGAVHTDMWRDRPGFDPADMLTADDVAAVVADVLARPPHVRVDEVRVSPAKGVL